MNNIHTIITKELEHQHELKQSEWLRGIPIDTDWKPDWPVIRDLAGTEVLRNSEVSDFLYKEFGDDYDIAFDGMVYMCWERLTADRDFERERFDILEGLK